MAKEKFTIENLMARLKKAKVRFTTVPGGQLTGLIIKDATITVDPKDGTFKLEKTTHPQIIVKKTEKIRKERKPWQKPR